MNKNNYFLRIYELKKKFRYVKFDNSHKKEIVRKCSSCLFQKFDGFYIVRIENEKKIRKKILRIDIIYEPVKNKKENINCYFLDQINLEFRGTFSNGKKIKRCSAWQCYLIDILKIALVSQA